jgi:hypothetical protein
MIQRLSILNLTTINDAGHPVAQICQRQDRNS